MNSSIKKLLAILVIVLIAVGGLFTFKGVNGVEPIKDKIKMGLDIKGGVYVLMEAQTDLKGPELTKLMEQTQAVIEQRVNQMGLSEPVVTVEGSKRIRVELPGAENNEEAIKQIGRTAQLQFLLADGTIVVDGSMVKNAGVTQDSNGGYAVSLEFNKEGTEAFKDATAKAKSGTVESKIQNVLPEAIAIVLDNNIISAPVVNNVITNGNAIITSGATGGFPQSEAVNLSALIRGGALPVELKEIKTSTQSASIGYNAFETSVKAGIIGIVLVLLVMLITYGLMGLAADIALILYILLVIWSMSSMGTVLTLPGVGGLILSVGMAVDANVIIFSRIKEEISNGKTVRVAVQSGFKRALSTILDSQITTMIAAIVLYQFGTGPVKGFAMTLMIGIIASIFTATVVTQLFLSIISESKNFGKNKFFGMNEDNTPKFMIKKQFNFIKHRKKYYAVAAVIILIGLISGGVRGYNYGIDFTGGTMMQIDMHKNVDAKEVVKVAKTAGVENLEVVHAGKDNKEVIIRTKMSLDNKQREKLINAFSDKFKIEDKDLLAVDQFGPSVGKELRVNALRAILIAALGMLIYIIIRFEWRFGIASISGVVHDILMVLAFYGIFGITINSPFIAGILTVVGYSINDTIVVFDRVRENIGFFKKNKNEDLINTSVNQTLTRSIMTSFTTLVVMLPMYILASSTIREFMLPLIIGVLVGCMSSIFMCSPIYYELAQLTSKRKYEKK